MPLFGLIQMLLGAGVLIFALTKYLLRPKRKKTDGYLIRNVHVIVGGGSELLEAGIYGIEHGILDEALPPDDDAGDRSRRENAAEHLGVAQRKGLVEEGMEADLILLEKNPAEDIANIRFVDKVFRKGQIVFSQKAIASYDLPNCAYPAETAIISGLPARSKARRRRRRSRSATDCGIRRWSWRCPRSLRRRKKRSCSIPSERATTAGR